jgi:glucose-fructose oxidoreductase
MLYNQTDRETNMDSEPNDGQTNHEQRRIRYAVVGLGHIAQVAVLPAFKHAAGNSQLSALVSSDPIKLKKLARKYRVSRTCGYDRYDELLQSGQIDAVYIALPNHLHCEYTVRAAEAGMHVLCEKPMAVTEAECHKMIAAAASSDVRLMIAYRLHFEEANLKAIEIVQSGELGEPRFFQSSFSMQVKENNIRVSRETGGGPLYDIGIYCINAARYLFRDEPIEVTCFTANNGEERFAEIEEMASAILRFPKQRLASFTCSFGAADVSEYRVVGTNGNLVVEPAYEYQEKLAHRLTIDGKTRKQVFAKRDQFAPELIHFSTCILEGRAPEPAGPMGLADIRIIEGLFRSAEVGAAVPLEPVEQPSYPGPELEMHKPPVEKPEVVHAESGSQ